jgi:hypothetical protein
LLATVPQYLWSVVVDLAIERRLRGIRGKILVLL